jgi:hypothetical protein
MADIQVTEETSIDVVLRKIAERSESNFIEVTETEIIELNSQDLLLLVTLREASSPRSSTERTQTVVIKTKDGGASWRGTLDASRGTVSLDESFFLADDMTGDISHLWLITQWQIEGTFPTLYWTTDAGDTWQSSSAIHEFLVDKGHSTFNFAEGLRFRSVTEGVIVARALSTDSGEDPIYFLQTEDGGKTWKEISNIPSWYFREKDARAKLMWREKNFRVNNYRERISIEKLVSSFPVVLKFQENVGE